MDNALTNALKALVDKAEQRIKNAQRTGRDQLGAASVGAVRYADCAPVMDPRLPLLGLALLAALTACASAPSSHASHGTTAETAGSPPSACPQKAEMKRQMVLIQAETDPAKKNRLIAEHHQAMQGGQCASH